MLSLFEKRFFGFHGSFDALRDLQNENFIGQNDVLFADDFINEFINAVPCIPVLNDEGLDGLILFFLLSQEKLDIDRIGKLQDVGHMIDGLFLEILDKAVLFEVYKQKE